MAKKIDPSAPSAVERAYYAYRHAKAAWDVACYAPDVIISGVPDAVNDPLCAAHTAALEALMLAPAATPRDLWLKLCVHRDEELHEWHRAQEFAGRLADDAHSIAFGV